MKTKKILLAAALLLMGFVMVAAYNRPYRWWPINEMTEQPIIKPFNEGAFLPPAEGSVAVEDYEPAPDRMLYVVEDGGFTNPFAGQESSIQEGQKLYDIYCISCHGKEMSDQPGYKSPVQEKGPMPGTSVAILKMMNRKDGYIYGTLSHGSAIMQRYNYNLSPDERWHIVSYIRHLESKVQQ